MLAFLFVNGENEMPDALPSCTTIHVKENLTSASTRITPRRIFKLITELFRE
jgi:hypothetical protein